MENMKKLKLLYFSSWPPLPCGIARFAFDMATAIQKAEPKMNWEVIASEFPDKTYKYSQKVIKTFNRENLNDYRKMADFCNHSSFDLVVIQHEFNIYGAPTGINLLSFVKNLKKPAVAIIHTVPDPYDKRYIYRKKQLPVLKNLHPFLQKLITMCQSGGKRLEKICGVPPSKIEIIPHGSINFPAISPASAKKQLGFKNNILILTFGFVSPRKGHEILIEAFAKVSFLYPSARLILLGSGHPAQKQKDKIYLNQLKRLAKKLKIEKKIRLFQKFIPLSLIKLYYKAADVCVITNPYKSQISSGPLTYALGAGKAIVSTNFDYAKDVLKKERGILVPIGKSEALTKGILEILGNPKLKKSFEKKSAAFGKTLFWDIIALKYIKLFQKVIKREK
jgi:glycosyltransferase involved in cell wall biosynthesis